MTSPHRQAPTLEDNWTRCQRLAREIDRDVLIRALLMQIAKMRRPRDKSVPLWSFVGEATSHGSGVSSGICSVYGVNSCSGEPICAMCKQVKPDVSHASTPWGSGLICNDCSDEAMKDAVSR
jgi:hypothetical protein